MNTTPNEGPIACRLRSRSKPELTGGIDAYKQSVTHGKQELKNQHTAKCNKDSQIMASSSHRISQNSKHQEQKIKSSAANNSMPSSTDVGKEIEKAIAQQKQAIKSKEEHMVYHIRWNGFDKTSERCSCALCEKDIAHLPNEEQREHEENELLCCSLLPETAVFRCGHVFHNICLSATPLTELSDPPCPICVTML